MGPNISFLVLLNGLLFFLPLIAASSHQSFNSWEQQSRSRSQSASASGSESVQARNERILQAQNQRRRDFLNQHPEMASYYNNAVEVGERRPRVQINDRIRQARERREARHRERKERQKREDLLFDNPAALSSKSVHEAVKDAELLFKRMIRKNEPVPDPSEASSVNTSSNWERAKIMLAIAADNAGNHTGIPVHKLVSVLREKVASTNNMEKKRKYIDRYARYMYDQVRQGVFVYPDLDEETALAYQRQDEYDREQAELEAKDETQYLTVEY